MKINMSDCLKLCAVFLQLEDALEMLCGQSSDTEGERLADAEKDIALLTRCVNLVVREIASEYVHLKACESFNSGGGRISYASFSRPPVNIFAVKKNGRNCRFKLYPSDIITESGNVEVHYTYLPDNKDADGVLDFEEGKISVRIIAYGAAAEYCMIRGLYEEACVWDKRYKDSLMSAARAAKSLALPERQWC